MKIAPDEKIAVFRKTTDYDIFFYTGIIANIDGEQRRKYIKVFLSDAVKERINSEARRTSINRFKVTVDDAWMTLTVNGEVAVFINRYKKLEVF